jgi:hypothetical protein
MKSYFNTLSFKSTKFNERHFEIRSSIRKTMAQSELKLLWYKNIVNILSISSKIMRNIRVNNRKQIYTVEFWSTHETEVVLVFFTLCIFLNSHAAVLLLSHFIYTGTRPFEFVLRNFDQLSEILNS